MMNRIDRKYFTDEALMSYAQIFLMVVGLFAFGYVFNEYFENDDRVSPALINAGTGNLGKVSLFDKLGKYMLDSLQRNIVSAQVIGEGCCAVTKTGNTCQTTMLENCNPDFQSAPTSCENTEFCEPGCCISPENGLCNRKTSRVDCEQTGGTFERGELCNVQECRPGCCIIGGESIWTTDANCEFEGNTENKDLPTDWRPDIESELQCLFIAEANKEGACVFDSEDGDEKRCVLTSLDDCFKRTGSEANFAKDVLCSDPILNTTCEAQDHKGCVAGEEDVYYFDSCGNKEDIAEDCDFYRGDYCGKELNEYTCKDIRCDTDGDGIKDRTNGESWCSYDSYIGDGKDTGGSRHIKHICNMGTERVAPCADFRNEICVQEDAGIEGGTFSQAACRVNQWRTCLDFNKIKDEGSLTSKCEQNPDCWVKHVEMSGSFDFKVCLPEYPPGFDLLPDSLYDENGQLNEAAYYQASAADGICDIASLKCTETWICGIFGCVCSDNCDCHTSKFTKEMNDFCTALGDCGSYINYLGEGTDTGYAVRASGGGGPPRLSNDQFGHSKYATQPSKPAPPGDFSFFETLNPGLLSGVHRKDNASLSPFESELLGAAGAYGNPLLLEILKQGADNESDLRNINAISSGVIGLSRFTGAISSSKAGILAQIGEYDKEVKDYSMIIAMIAGLIAFAITSSVMIAMIAALLGFLLGIFWIKKVHIYFTCMPWDPPDGGGDCNKCNTLDVPCTEYRCESLGQLCKLINEGTGNDLCVAKPSNETIPVIEPFENAISEGYKYHNIGPEGFEVVNASNNGCLEPYEPVDIGIKVDPFAKCRIGPNPDDNFEDMFDAFGPKGNNILPAHLMKLFFPSPEAFRNVYNLTDEQIKVLGKIDYYIKCRTASGKTNPEPYNLKTCIKPGPDLTPPRVIITRPVSGKYIKFGTTEEDVVIYVNEPSECRYDLQDLDFDQMNNSLDCDIDPANYTLYGLACTTTLTGLDVNDKFYIRCRDISDNANTMEESYVYEVKRSESKLFIDEMIPRNSEVIESGVEPTSVKLRLRTSGGANKGEALCEWSGFGGDRFRYEEPNGSSSHEYEINIPGGQYLINFMCEDQAGNIAENSTSFRVNIDKSGPRITRIYFDGGLKVVTSEEAECRYSFLRNFKFDNATKMGSDGKNHFAGFLPRTYYVQCKDNLGNKGGRIRVKPYVS